MEGSGENRKKGVQRPQRIRVKPKDEAVYYASRGKDREGLDVKFINSLKGRVVFAKRHLERGEFLVEYRGDLMEKKKYERRVKLYHKGLKVFMFEFCYNGKQLCIDAAKEDGSLGRLVNDDHINPNGKIKTVTVKGHPHLCVFATKDIKPKEAITYNNGDSDWPWRMKISEDKHPADDDTPIATTSLPDEKQISEDRHPADDDTPKASTSLPDEKQISEDRHPADDDTPKASTSLPDEKQISEDRHPADDDTPKASTSLPDEKQISEERHPADNDTPIASTSVPDEKQISEDRHPADDDTPKASTSLPDEKQISEDRHPADDDTPKASTSLPDEKQISEERHPADNDTPIASTSVPDEKQISEDRHPADDDTPKASTSLPDEKQISEDRHPADDDTPKASTSLPDEKQISEDRHPADDDTPKASTSLPDEKQSFQHKVGSSSASSFEKCAFCHGPLSARKWICVKYKALPENYAEMEDPRRKQKRPWSPKEIAAVMRHFQEHIANGKLATVVEIKQCRSGEHPTLASRPVQNIIDFVRNRGLIQKRKKQQKENSC
ncbi:SET domain-containing protein 5-like isoform X16 [Oryzias latipes]|uniref:SET domain-containing protein 5-like isoform X16 n=1 Tax=Oryzias latipes TaxID=8090 RepID=UPI000CE248C3|nr:SET domain-containing protein 5-like isoform X16 [Oryzias latipes]